MSPPVPGLEPLTDAQRRALKNPTGKLHPSTRRSLINKGLLTEDGKVTTAGKDALFSIIAKSEYDLVGMVPTRDIAKLKTEQTARLKISGAGEMDGKVRLIAPTTWA